ncbi:MAG: FtsB family cell division protein [Patescibacteria group bacterium]
MSTRLKQKFYTVFLVILIILVLLPLVRGWRQKKMIEEEISGFKAEISAKEAGNKKLREAIAYLESDSSLEETARLNLGMKKPGESVAVIKEELSTSSVMIEKTEIESNYRKWFRYFFN